MTPEREKAFEAYVAALRAAFESLESHEDAVIRVALTPTGSDRPVAFALVVGHQDLNENGRMALLSELFRQMSPHNRIEAIAVQLAGGDVARVCGCGEEVDGG